MPWLRIDDRVRTHPKIVAAGPDASWFWFCGICYCREHLTDGFIPQGILASLCPGVGLAAARRLAAKLVAENLWHKTEDGYRVHDFLDWNPARDVVMAKRKEERDRKERERKGSVRADNAGLSSVDTGEMSDTDIPDLSDTDKSSLSERTNRGVREVSSRDRAIARGSGLGLGSGSGSEESRETKPKSLVRSMKPWNAWEGERLEVPQRWHDDHVKMLGGPEAAARLEAWYATLDTQLVRAKTTVRKWFQYLDRCYESWLPEDAPAAVDDHIARDLAESEARRRSVQR